MTSLAADIEDFSKILLIKLSAVGDVVHTIPVLNKLRRRYPAAQIDWLVTPPIAELLRHHPAITNVIEFAREEWQSPWRLTPFANYARLAASLRATGYDLVVDMHGQLRTALLTLATGAPVRDRLRPAAGGGLVRFRPRFPELARKHAWQGAREGSWLAYTHHIPVPTLDVHAVDRYLNVGPILGLDDGAADFSFPIPAAASARIEQLAARARHAARHCSCSRRGRSGKPSIGAATNSRKWRGISCRTALPRRSSDHGASAPSARRSLSSPRVRSTSPARHAFSELAALIRRSTICVTNDSGPMHLAVALGRPVASVFGPTDAIWIGPYRRKNAVLQANLPCSPCYLRQLSRCPHGHACMHDVSARAAIERMEAMVGGRAASAGVVEMHAPAR